MKQSDVSSPLRRNRNAVLLLTGLQTSYVGTYLAPVAITLAALHQGLGASGVGIIFACESAALVLCVLVGGIAADRYSRRNIMMGADAIRCIGHTSLAIALLGRWASLPVFIAAQIGIGIGDAMFGPALTGLIPILVHRDHLQRFNAVRETTQSLGSVAGPAAAGLLVALGNYWFALAVDALTYLASAVCLGRLSIPVQGKTTVGESVGMWRQLARGWHEFNAMAWIRAMVVQASLFHLMAYAPFLVIGAVVASETKGPAVWGVVVASIGLGSALGGVVMTRLRPQRPLVRACVCLCLFALPFWSLASKAPLAVTIVCGLLGGIGITTYSVIWTTALQTHVRDELLSTVSSYDWMGSLVALPVGFALAGLVDKWIGSTTALAGSGIVLIVLCLLPLASPAVRHLGTKMVEVES